MNVDAVRERTCTRKLRRSERDARSFAVKLRASGVAVSPYRCPFCRGWHVGHPPSMETVELLARVIRGL